MAFDGLASSDLPDYLKGTPNAVEFSPYELNGGSVVAIAGTDFAILGSDTRLSVRYSIYTREQPKLFRFSDKTVLGSTGCWCDVLTLTRILKARMQMYLLEHHKPMPTAALAQMLSNLLYYKRFFPYYVSNILAGLDEKDNGCVFSYDPIGHCERSTFRAGGTAGHLMQPLLDNQIGLKNMENVVPLPISLDNALGILKDVFISAAERDIYTGDSVLINIITKDGVREEVFMLRKD